ncbi:MAG: alpha/beta hydrolase [Acidobacteriaceae bacterium]
MKPRPTILFASVLLFASMPLTAQSRRSTPPTRHPDSSGFVKATELPDTQLPPPTADGNYIIGPTHPPAPELAAFAAEPHPSGQAPRFAHGSVTVFTMTSAESKIYPGIARIPNVVGHADPKDPAKMIVTNSRPAPWTREVAVYVPASYKRGTAAPFIVGADGPDWMLFAALDSLIAEHRIPVMIGISIANGGQDAQGSERGLEYDTMSGRYAEFVEGEILPRVEARAHIRLTHNPDGRAATGGSSGGAAALEMAWYRPDLYHRVLTYSGTFVNQQWPYNPATPHGAWEFHEHLIAESPRKPIRIWLEVGDHDLLNPNSMHDGMHDWVTANERMASVLAAKHYHYQFVFAENAGHVDRAVRLQTLPEALEYIWQGYGESAPGKHGSDLMGK